MVFYYAHRINTVEELKGVPRHHGIEIDIRDANNDLILSHDPFSTGENFEEFLKNYDKSSVILNIKSERIEYKVLELLKKYDVKDYFFLDCSFPMIYQLNKIGEKNIAVRFSEFETIESVLRVKDMVRWVWVDCFTEFPMDSESYKRICNAGLKICLVSPELQGHSVEKIQEYKEHIDGMVVDAVCTKIYNIDKWKYLTEWQVGQGPTRKH